MRGAPSFRALAFLLAGVTAASAVAVGLAPTAASAATPRTVEVLVVPEYAGVHLTVDGIPVVTGPGGTQTIVDPDLGGAASHVVLPQQQLSRTLRVATDRVTVDPNHGPFSRRLIVELDADSAVTLHLVSPQRMAVPPGEVQRVTLSDSLGGTIQIGASELRSPVWLPSSRPSSAPSGVDNRLVTFSVQSVMVDGSNIVNSGQLRFAANRSLTWTVPVILRSLTVVGNDLLAGSPAGTSAQITYPNGFRRTVAFGPHHRVTLSNLPRGSYGVKVLGGVLPLASTVRLSRNQTDVEIVVTAGDVADLAGIALIILALVVAAGVLGRRRRLVAARNEFEAGSHGAHGGANVAVS